MAIKGKIEGLDLTKYNLNQAGRAVIKGIKTGLRKSGFLVERSAKNNAPVDLGTLKNSISTSNVFADEKGVLSVLVGSDIEYAKFVEFGTGVFAVNGQGRKTPWVYFDERKNQFIKTRGQKPQPYLEPALKDSRKKIKPLIDKEIQSAIDKANYRKASK